MGNRNKTEMDYKSPVYHRKLAKIFDKYAANVHPTIVHLIFECLGYDRITFVVLDGKAELKNISNDECYVHAYSDACVPGIKGATIKEVYENEIGYKVDASSNGKCKHYMNVGWDLGIDNIGSNLHRHAPFQNHCAYAAKVWIPSQNPIQHALIK